MFKLVVFDLEGTLVKHTTRQAKIVENSITSQGIKLSIDVEYLYSLRSKPEFHSAKDFVKELLKRNETSFDEKLIELIVNEYKKLRQDPAYLFELQYLFPGVKETLSQLKQNGTKLVLLTNANPKQTNYLLERFDLKKYFDLVLDDSCELPEKPDPARINFILEKFDLNPDEVLIVEDSEAGIEAGKKAKIKTCGVLTGNATEKGLKVAKADYILESVKELMESLTF